MIEFQYVRWKNFLSYGDKWTEIQLNRNPTTLMIGDNGAGKTTLLDSICFSLYDKPYRKINKAQLVNSINKKSCETEIGFNVGKTQYKICRGIKPNYLTIFVDGKERPSSAKIADDNEYICEQILGINYNTFCQIAIIGKSNYGPFMQLKPDERRKVIEDLLDIRIFGIMQSVCKEKIRVSKTDYESVVGRIDVLKEKQRLKEEYKKKREEENEHRLSELKGGLAEILLSIEKSASIVDKLFEQKENLKSELESKEVNSPQKMKREGEKILYRTEQKIREAKEKIQFYESNEECPTCNLPMDVCKKSDILEGLKQELEKQNAKKQTVEEGMVKIEASIKEIEKTEDQIRKIEGEESNNKTAMTRLDYKRELIEEQIQEIEKRKEEVIEETTDLFSEIEEQQKEKDQLVNVLQSLKLLQDSLKDGAIKAHVIRQYVPLMNNYINNFLESLEFLVKFELDEEFNETIKSRYRDAFSYHSFSEGEKSRIDLSLLLTWREIARIKNSASTNLLILDETFDASMDAEGCGDFTGLLDRLSQNTHVFVISHRESLGETFRSMIKFRKDKNFSNMESS